MWGHAGNANLHMQPFLDLGQVGDRQKVFKIIDEYYNMVISLGGSTSGGDTAMVAFVPRILRSCMARLCTRFSRKVKQIFDPYSTLNPGVKIDVTLDDVKPLLRHEYSMEHLGHHLPRS